MSRSKPVSLSREVRRRRETIQTVVVLALLAGGLVYGLLVQISHHP
jgi:hypothetical protein